jgi:hypothetical protein
MVFPCCLSAFAVKSSVFFIHSRFNNIGVGGRLNPITSPRERYLTLHDLLAIFKNSRALRREASTIHVANPAHQFEFDSVMALSTGCGSEVTSRMAIVVLGEQLVCRILPTVPPWHTIALLGTYRKQLGLIKQLLDLGERNSNPPPRKSRFTSEDRNDKPFKSRRSDRSD